MLLAFDLDGVVADFDAVASAWIEREFGYPPFEHTEWDWFTKYPDYKMVKRAFWRKGVEQEHLLLDCPVYPDAHDTLWRLWNDGHEIEFVTHRKQNVYDDTRQWLNTNNLPWAVHCIEEKWQRNADFYLDDKPENVQDITANGGDAYLFARPWNVPAQEYLPTIRTWAQVDWLLCCEFRPEYG